MKAPLTTPNDKVAPNPALTTSCEHFPDGPELVIAFVAAVGVNLPIAEDAVRNRLEELNYHVEEVKVTRDVLPKLNSGASQNLTVASDRIGKMMDFGTEARRLLGTNILAKGIAAEISARRAATPSPRPRTAYLVHSLKHPDEVRQLRELYPRGFYLFGVHAHPDMRRKHLMNVRKMTRDDAEILMKRDRKENVKHGQQVNDTFHLADFFVGWGGDDELGERHGDLAGLTDSDKQYNDQVNTRRVKVSVDRFIDIIFAHPHRTPTFGEYSMFLAFTASLRSADLSRQVGAVIAREGEILSTGANDCPTARGGLYWPKFNTTSGDIEDARNGRDYMRGFDSNRREQDALIREILDGAKAAEIDEAALNTLHDVLNESQIRNLTEYGRVVHAEMEALLACARKWVSTKEATMYCTTFPCHNCAKHIIAAGIERVVFVEPYLKSKAFEFHEDAIVISYPQDNYMDDNSKAGKKDDRVKFEPFFGVGPRRFFDLFSMSLGVGEPVRRKDENGNAVSWYPGDSLPRLKMRTSSYLDLESDAAAEFRDAASQLGVG